MIDTDGQHHLFFDMCGYCEIATGGNHQSHCPMFQQQMREGYQETASTNLKIAEDYFDLAMLAWPKYQEV